MSDDEVILAGSAADSASEATGGDAAALHPPEVERAHGATRRRVRRHDAPGPGSFMAWLVVDEAISPPKRCVRSDGARPDLPARQCVIGFCKVSWAYKTVCDDASAKDTFLTVTPRSVLRSGFGEPPLGFLEYKVDEIWRLEDMVPLADDFASRSAAAPLKLRRLCGESVLAGQVGTVPDFLAHCNPLCDVTFVVSSTILGRLFVGPLPIVASSCKLCSKVSWRGRVPDNPPVASIRAWTRNALRNNAEPAVAVDAEEVQDYDAALLELPANTPLAPFLEDDGAVRTGRGGLTKREEDPVRLLDACRFAKFLRAAKDFTEALNAGHRYDHGRASEPRDATHDVVGTTILKVKGRFDVVDCLIMRRQFKADRNRDAIVHITLYSDSSPTTGEELQGQVLDIIKTDDSHVRVVLPGASLTYGHFDAVNKCIGLLWACWLVAGPDLASMQYFVSKVRCLCTDMGVEMHLLETRDCLEAFVAWVGGQPLQNVAPLVRQDKRLFYKALRISGWSHMSGNLSKTILNRTASWPAKLDKVRDLIWFYSNATYRKHVKRRLRDRPVNAIDLDNFSADLATWRYETIAKVFSQLLTFREISEDYVEREMFQNVQDRVSLDASLAAMKDKSLWRFMAAVYRFVAKPTEKLRRRGVVCECVDHVRMRTEDRVRHIECWKNSRRLKGASARITEEIERDRQTARDLTPESCEGDVGLCGTIQGMLGIKVAELGTRSRYLQSAPWCFVNADSVQGATHLLDRVARFDMAQHDALTQDLVAQFGADVQVVKDGGPVSQALAREIKIMCWSPLDESAGEGVHRSDTLEIKRATGSTIQHVKQSARERGVFQRLNDFVETHGIRGRRVLRYEFHSWKRILQIRTDRQWNMPKEFTERAALDRIYREDDMAEEDWSSAVSTAPAHEKAQAEKKSEETNLANEYLVAVMERNAFYSVDVPRMEVDPDGRDKEVVKPVFSDQRHCAQPFPSTCHAHGGRS